jgi:hypothetical protein
MAWATKGTPPGHHCDTPPGLTPQPDGSAQTDEGDTVWNGAIWGCPGCLTHWQFVGFSESGAAAWREDTTFR